MTPSRAGLAAILVGLALGPVPALITLGVLLPLSRRRRARS